MIGLVVLRGRELYFSLLTLGVGQLVWATAHGWQSLTGGTNGTNGVFAAEWINAFQHPDQLYWFIFGCVLVCTAMLYVITNSPFGDALRGIRENYRRAEFAGLWVKRYELTAFMIAAMFGAIAGGLSVIGETQITSGHIDWHALGARAHRRADRRHAVLPRPVRRRVLLPLRLRLGHPARRSSGTRSSGSSCSSSRSVSRAVSAA